ncbi:MAG: HAD hydrolase family protein [Pseudomonadota bacterium]
MPTELSAIQLLAFDVDGVLTDGRIWFDEEGREMHAFHVHDGMGMVLASRRGPLLVAISGRGAPGVKARLTQLRVREIHLGIDDKVQVLRDAAGRHDIPLEACCFVGDDINDVATMKLVGLAVAPANAHPSALTAAHWCTQARAGHGVLREVLDAIWMARPPLEGARS